MFLKICVFTEKRPVRNLRKMQRKTQYIQSYWLRVLPKWHHYRTFDSRKEYNLNRLQFGPNIVWRNVPPWFFKVPSMHIKLVKHKSVEVYIPEFDITICRRLNGNISVCKAEIVGQMRCSLTELSFALLLIVWLQKEL